MVIKVLRKPGFFRAALVVLGWCLFFTGQYFDSSVITVSSLALARVLP